jgi:hypothetical protein
MRVAPKEVASLEPELDRLYSRFPGGTVGSALLLLRLIDGIGLIGEGIHISSPADGSSQPASALLFGLVLVATAILLILGLRTSLTSGAAALCTAGFVLSGRYSFTGLGIERYAWLFLFAILFFLSSALVLLGPGGYSLDARFSGWQRIKLSSRRPNERGEDTKVEAKHGCDCCSCESSGRRVAGSPSSGTAEDK